MLINVTAKPSKDAAAEAKLRADVKARVEAAEKRAQEAMRRAQVRAARHSMRARNEAPKSTEMQRVADMLTNELSTTLLEMAVKRASGQAVSSAYIDERTNL